MSDDYIDTATADIERLLAIGIGVQEGHAMTSAAGRIKPGPNTMRVAREVLRRHAEADLAALRAHVENVIARCEDDAARLHPTSMIAWANRTIAAMLREFPKGDGQPCKRCGMGSTAALTEHAQGYHDVPKGDEQHG